MSKKIGMRRLFSLAAVLGILAGIAPATAAGQAGAERHRGKVTATMDSGGYTYIEFDENGKKLWAAAPPFKVKVGDLVDMSGGMPMKDFASPTLKRTFDEILFVAAVQVGGAGGAPAAALPSGHVPIPSKSGPPAVTVPPGSIVRAENGRTVEECYARKNELKGRTVRIRGRVVKFNPDIMGLNWLHIRDGSGDKDTNDLTVTTKDRAAVGDLVLVTGTLARDKDLGSGYAFPILVENASVRVEGEPKR
jgi:hypothetical protein